ncbi:MAG TPA: penicillin-binding protein 2 [Planctomycetota bacterium]|nr:penicillin-binding protein 2 [Planctomycetota bacterium]
MSWNAGYDEVRTFPEAALDKWHHLRGAVLLSVLLAGFVALGVRLVHLQVLRHEELAAKAEGQQEVRRQVEARRGAFFDRMGRPLCVSVPGRSVFLVPSSVKDADVSRTATLLADALDPEPGKTREVLARELADEIRRRRAMQFMWVKRQVSDAEGARVASLGLGCVHFRREYRRAFPQGITASHLVGWTNVDEEGQEGLERVYDRVLRGSDGFARLECDGLRRTLVSDRTRVKPVTHGANIQLTLDVEVQRFVEEELTRGYDAYRPVSAIAIVMEVRTGRILALANRPDYDPAHPADPDDPDGKRRLNHAVVSRYEPGSIFKPFVMAGYFESGLGRVDDTIFCENGLFRHRARRLRDHHPFGYLTVGEILWKSSNIGMAKIGLALGERRVFDTVTAFGFGSSTGSGLPGENPGKVRAFREWSYYTVTSVPMGHEIEATPMQLITAFNALANGGLLVKPQLVESIADADGNILERFEGPEFSLRVVSEETARRMVDPMMTGVIEQGTGKGANFGEYRKFGKTGTAQKVVDGEYSHTRFVSSFVCGAPVEDPQVSVLVLFDEPTVGTSFYGGSVAAPIAARIIEHTLKVLGVPGGTPARREDT